MLNKLNIYIFTFTQAYTLFIIYKTNITSPKDKTEEPHPA